MAIGYDGNIQGGMIDDLAKSHPKDGFVKSSRGKARKN
jgi:hypothetical protein